MLDLIIVGFEKRVTHSYQSSFGKILVARRTRKDPFFCLIISFVPTQLVVTHQQSISFATTNTVQVLGVPEKTYREEITRSNNNIRKATTTMATPEGPQVIQSNGICDENTGTRVSQRGFKPPTPQPGMLNEEMALQAAKQYKKKQKNIRKACAKVDGQETTGCSCVIQ